MSLPFSPFQRAVLAALDITLLERAAAPALPPSSLGADIAPDCMRSTADPASNATQDDDVDGAERDRKHVHNTGAAREHDDAAGITASQAGLPSTHVDSAVEPLWRAIALAAVRLDIPEARMSDIAIDLDALRNDGEAKRRLWHTLRRLRREP